MKRRIKLQRLQIRFSMVDFSVLLWGRMRNGPHGRRQIKFRPIHVISNACNGFFCNSAEGMNHRNLCLSRLHHCHTGQRPLRHERLLGRVMSAWKHFQTSVQCKEQPLVPSASPSVGPHPLLPVMLQINNDDKPPLFGLKRNNFTVSFCSMTNCPTSQSSTTPMTIRRPRR